MLRPLHSSNLANVLRLQPLWSLGNVELDVVALCEAPEPLRLDRCEVDEHVRTRLLRDKAKALRVVKPLHLTLCHTGQTSERGALPRSRTALVTAARDGLKQKPRDEWSSRCADKPVT